MEGPIGRYARTSEGYTGTKNVAHVLGACVAATTLALVVHELIAAQYAGIAILPEQGNRQRIQHQFKHLLR
jgi:hypothetical protein